MESKQAICYIYFLISVIIFVLYYWFDKKKLELRLLVILIVIKVKYGHDQVSMPKVGIPVLKTPYINPKITELFWFML